MNWLDDEGRILFHCNLRPDFGAIALNSRLAGDWDDETRVPLDVLTWKPRNLFDLSFVVLPDRFIVLAGDRVLAEFPHRADPATIRKVRSSTYVWLPKPSLELAARAARSLAESGDLWEAQQLASAALREGRDHPQLQDLVLELRGLEMPQRIREWRMRWPLLSSLVSITGMQPATLLELTYPTGAPISLPLLELSRDIRLRPGTSDLFVLIEVCDWGHHRVGPGLAAPRTVLDLGAHIGITLAQFAHRYPQARIVGVELDAENAALARENVAPWGERIQVDHCAVAATRGPVRYRHEPGEEWAHAIAEDGNVEVTAKTVDDLLAQWFPDQELGLLKMDVEGAEREIIAAGGAWAQRTRVLEVELHGDYEPPEARSDLARLGFTVTDAVGHGRALVAERGCSRTRASVG